MASLLTFLGNLPCAGATNWGAALRAFAARSRNPGLVILISDLLGAEGAQAGIEVLRSGGHDVVVIHLLAESEIDPPLDGALRMVDAETGDELEVTVDEELRRHYRHRLDRRLRVNRLRHVLAGQIAVPDVVLRIDRALCRFDQRQPLGERVHAAVENAHATEIAVSGARASAQTTQLGRGGVEKCSDPAPSAGGEASHGETPAQNRDDDRRDAIW